MSREEIQKLLGGYATDTLSEAERSALLEAALEDQELFDALAKEQALRDVLREPAARQQLIEALGPAHEPYAARVWRWLRRPAALAMAGGAAALLILAGLVLRQTKHPARREVMVADALVPRSVPQVKAIEPPAVVRQPKRPARLPASRDVPAPQPLAKAAPSPAPPPGAVASGAFADTAEAKRQLLQPTKTASQNFTAREGQPMAALSRAKAAVPAAAKLAVAYTLLLRDADGAYAPVPSGTVFHAGDSVRIQVEPNESGYIYLLRREETAGWSLVEGQRVEKAQHYEVPSIGGFQSDVPARLELLLAISRVEHADVDALASQAPASSRITIEFR